MFRWGTVLGLAACSIAFGDARISALSATGPSAMDPVESTISQGIVNADPKEATPAGPAVRERPPLRGNPLWGVPLSSLSVTRERPIFSPSRRPPPPAVVAAPHVAVVAPPPPKPEEPNHPPLKLVGTVVGETDGIGIFFDETSKNVVRLRIGQNHTGWVLRSIQGREATFEKDHRTATLALPPPGAEQTDQASIPFSAAAQEGDTWVDGDGRKISPPPKRSQSMAVRPLSAASADPEVN